MSSFSSDSIIDNFSNLSCSTRSPITKPKFELDQRNRREKLLHLQKESRNDIINHQRQLLLDTITNNHEPKNNKDDTNSQDSEAMQITPLTKNQKLEMKLMERYKDNLMIPEEMTDIPLDLSTHWICVPCPLGKRCLVISSHGKTVTRLRNGALLHSFPSFLPGGQKSRSCKKSVYCILDCILYEPTFTYYILDMMCWGGTQYYNCDTEFRFFWVATKISEEDRDLSSVGPDNHYRFICLPRYSCDPKSLNQGFQDTLPFKRDGFLFYHKSTHYCNEITPLVCSLSEQKVELFMNNLKQLEV